MDFEDDPVSVMKERRLDGFGQRLAEIRKARGLTQTRLGKVLGVSQRVITYYEVESSQPPGPLLGEIARALRVSVDELLGVKPFKEKLPPRDARILNRVRRILDLPPSKRRSVVEHLESLLVKHNGGGDNNGRNRKAA